MKQLLNALEKEKGVRFGNFWRFNKKTFAGIVPIIVDDTFPRDYVMYEEVKDQVTVEDGGRINELKFKNNTGQPVFIRAGEIFEGKTQSRAVNIGIVLMPESEARVPVVCVHASHPIHSGTQLHTTSSYVPYDVNYAMSHSTYTGSGRTQSRTWTTISDFSARTSSEGEFVNRASLSQSTHDNLMNTIKQVKKGKKEISNLIKKIPSLENQIGIIVFDMSGVRSLELFDSPASWKALHESVYEGYSEILFKQEKKVLFKLDEKVIPHFIKEFIGLLKETESKTVFKDKGAMTMALTGKAIGEFTKIQSRIIHLIGMRREEEPEERMRITHEPIYEPHTSMLTIPTTTSGSFTTHYPNTTMGGTPYKSIKIKESTKARLNNLKAVPSETYDHVIKRASTALKKVKRK